VHDAAAGLLYAAATGIIHEQKEALTWVSRFQPFSNMGLIGRSVSRDTSTSLSLDRPSRLMNPPLQRHNVF